MSNSPNLLSEYTFLGTTLANRVAMAPLTRGRSGSDRVPNDLMNEYYVQRESAGVIIAEATVVNKQGIGWVDSPGIYNDAQTQGWKKICTALHQHNTPVVLQLWHCGRASHSSFHAGELPVSASAIKINGDEIHTPMGKKDYETPRALSSAEIAQTIQDYKQAAIRAKEAGFDGIEIHSANGYLLNQFLESKTNQRNDNYGGSLENRLRLLKEVTEAILEVWPADKVGVRLSPNGVFNDMGSPDYIETYTAAAELLNELNIGFLHVMDGLAFGFHELGEPMTLADFRKVFKNTIIGNCGYTEKTAEQAIANGDADIITFGRPFISTPDLPIRFRRKLPLADDADTSVWSASGPEGYTSFPSHSES